MGGMALVGVATLIANVLSYLLSMIAARVLLPAEFGAFGALTGVFIIVSTTALAMQLLAARHATLQNDSDESGAQLVRLSTYLAVALVAIGLVASIPLAALLATPYLALVLTFGAAAAYLIGYAPMGIAQGLERHVQLSWAFLANIGGRAVVGIAFVLVMRSVTGVSLGIFIGCLIGAAVSYRLCSWKAWSRAWGKEYLPEFGHMLHALLVLFTLTNIDVILARVFLNEDLSGEYSVGVLLAKVAFFLPSSIIIVLFPKMTSENSRRALLAASGLTAVIGIAVTLGSLLFGTLAARILGGAQYTELGSEMWLFALEGSAFALVQVLLYAKLAAEDKSAALLVWIALIVMAGVIVFWRHNSVLEIVSTVVVVSLVLTVVGLVWDLRGSTDEDSQLPPIEVAE